MQFIPRVEENQQQRCGSKPESPGRIYKDDGITKVKHLARDQLKNMGTGRKLQQSKMKKVVV